jgi:hypothetical protein
MANLAISIEQRNFVETIWMHYRYSKGQKEPLVKLLSLLQPLLESPRTVLNSPEKTREKIREIESQLSRFERSPQRKNGCTNFSRLDHALWEIFDNAFHANPEKLIDCAEKIKKRSLFPHWKKQYGIDGPLQWAFHLKTWSVQQDLLRRIVFIGLVRIIFPSIRLWVYTRLTHTTADGRLQLFRSCLVFNSFHIRDQDRRLNINILALGLLGIVGTCIEIFSIFFAYNPIALETFLIALLIISIFFSAFSRIELSNKFRNLKIYQCLSCFLEESAMRYNQNRLLKSQQKAFQIFRKIFKKLPLELGGIGRP